MKKGKLVAIAVRREDDPGWKEAVSRVKALARTNRHTCKTLHRSIRADGEIVYFAVCVIREKIHGKA